jgi:hypothetical protein
MARGHGRRVRASPHHRKRVEQRLEPIVHVGALNKQPSGLLWPKDRHIDRRDELQLAAHQGSERECAERPEHADVSPSSSGPDYRAEQGACSCERWARAAKVRRVGRGTLAAARACGVVLVVRTPVRAKRAAVVQGELPLRHLHPGLAWLPGNYIGCPANRLQCPIFRHCPGARRGQCLKIGH